MDKFDHGDIPPELRDVGERLRGERHVASPVELDRIKTRTMMRAAGPGATRGGAMRKRTLLTALIMVGAIGTGSAAALSIGGISIPSPTVLFSAKTLFPAKTAPAVPSVSSPSTVTSAAAAVYGRAPAIVTVSCRPAVINRSFPAGAKSSVCKAFVAGTAGVRPTGSITWTSSSSGTFNPPVCGLMPYANVTAFCTTSYTPSAGGFHFITAHYSGDGTYAASDSLNPALVTVI